MSNQPSTLEVLRTNAAEATHTFAEKIDLSNEKEASGWRTKNSFKNAQGEPCKKGSYTDQLNEAAYGGPNGLQKKESTIGKGEITC
jgi:hypothetical protein